MEIKKIALLLSTLRFLYTFTSKTLPADWSPEHDYLDIFKVRVNRDYLVQVPSLTSSALSMMCEVKLLIMKKKVLITWLNSNYTSSFSFDNWNDC